MRDLESELQKLGVVPSTWIDELSQVSGYSYTREEVKRWHTSLFNHETLEPLF